MNWKMARWIVIGIALASALLLTGIADNLLGFSLTYDLIGFELGTVVGIANFVAAWILYKVL